MDNQDEISCTVTLKVGMVFPMHDVYGGAVITKINTDTGFVNYTKDGKNARIYKRWLLEALFEREMRKWERPKHLPKLKSK